MDDNSTDADTAAVAMVRRIFDEGFATGDPAIADELCSPTMIEHQFGLAGEGEEAIAHVKAAMADVHRAFPDVSFVIEDSITRQDADGLTVWVRVHGRGTASGPFFGPPSNRPVDFTVFDVVRVVGGMVEEHWGVPDRFALLAQTGALDRLAQPAG